MYQKIALLGTAPHIIENSPLRYSDRYNFGIDLADNIFHLSKQFNFSDRQGHIVLVFGIFVISCRMLIDNLFYQITEETIVFEIGEGGLVD